MKKVIYSFRTFPLIFELKNLSDGVFIFSKIKEDLPRFFELVEKVKPDLIIGIAKSPNGFSHFETRAVNIFNKTKKVSRNNCAEYYLDYPSGGYKNFKINTKYTDSFCNYVMYKIAENTNIKQQFVHIAKNDFMDFKKYLNALR